MKVRIAAAAVALATMLGVITAVPGTASASSLPVVYGVPYGNSTGSNFKHGKIRPTGLLMWTGDGSAWFIIHSYRTWSRSGAWGSATLHARSCWGRCFHYKTGHATIHFYRVRRHRGRRYFTRLHFSLKRKVAGIGSATLKFVRRGAPAWYY